MLQSPNGSRRVLSALALVLAFVVCASPRIFAQDQDGDNDHDRSTTFADAFTPLVYSVQNTGANFPAPTFPSFAQLPIIRPLPDPFQLGDGDHDRDHERTSWERRRNDIMAAVEKYEIGEVPD